MARTRAVLLVVLGFLTSFLVTIGAAAPGSGADAAARLATPSVTSLTPAKGTIKGGIRITVRGSGFSQVKAVKFGTATGTLVRVLSRSTLTVRVPAHAAGRVYVTVRNTVGTSPRTVRYHYVANPVIRATALPLAEYNKAYRFAFSTTDSRSGTWQRTAGTWPAGLTMNSTGVLSGVPTGDTRAHPVTVRFTDVRGATASRALTVTVLRKASWLVLTSSTVNTCGLRADHSLWCWGDNFNGQLGNGSTTRSLIRVRVGTATDWASLAGGDFHSCAVKTNGTAWCWGFNSAGQLGNAATTTATTPVQVGSAADWATLDAGNAHTCGIKTDGTAWCWGSNIQLQLGTETVPGGQPLHYASSPVQVGVETAWTRISAGGRHTCALKADGTVWCWGSNEFGRLGDGTVVARGTPTQVGAGADWSTVSANASHTCATKTGGTAWCWGLNQQAQLGDGTTTNSLVPVQVGTGTDWVSAIGTEFHSCGLRTGGAAWCWGNNGRGQLGAGSTAVQSIPLLQVVSSAPWASLTASFVQACGLTTTGEALCWGEGGNGQFGNGTQSISIVPTAVF